MQLPSRWLHIKKSSQSINKFDIGTQLTTVANRISELPSYNWSLSMICRLSGLHLILEWNGNKPEFDFPGYNWISICYPNPASWAHANLAQMWQHVPDDRETKVFSTQRQESNNSLVSDFSLNMEGLKKWWTLSRITAWDDVVDVISQNEPTIKLFESTPPLMDWWNLGWQADKKQG